MNTLLLLPGLPRFFPFSRSPPWVWGGAGQASERGRPWSARHWTGRAGLEQQKEQHCWPRSLHLLEDLDITSVLNLLFAKPPLEACSWEGGAGDSHLGGFAGLKHLGLVAHCLRGQGCSSYRCFLLSYRWRGAGSRATYAESPPPELFFLGRVFSVLEADGYVESYDGD